MHCAVENYYTQHCICMYQLFTYHITCLVCVTGDGMGAYMTYLVTTKTTLPSFKEPEVFVRRRFSDFLGLYYRLAEKFMCLGYIVPPAPEKSVSGRHIYIGHFCSLPLLYISVHDYILCISNV